MPPGKRQMYRITIGWRHFAGAGLRVVPGGKVASESEEVQRAGRIDRGEEASYAELAGDEEKKDGDTPTRSGQAPFTERSTQSAQRKAQRRIGEEVEYVPRSLHCATAESAVAPVGMTKWMQFSGALG
jgi:hypothetical protein